LKDKPVIFITSGGTSVPLESGSGATLENFSTGTRGARSAEYFIKSGYPVIFFHRSGSISPFAIELETELRGNLNNYNLKQDSDINRFKQLVEVYQKYHKKWSPLSSLLTLVTYDSVQEYLSGLEIIS
jgi:phosphopantothenate---cysteine ligase (ATP)